MRIISLDLLLGPPRLQRRIDAERALLQRDLAALEDNKARLRAGVIHQATSLPALAAALATGFVATKLAQRPRRPRPAPKEEGKATGHEPNAALTATTSLAWQVMMPLVISWLQARFAPPEHPKEHRDRPPEP